jgi:hypothetical protein
MEGIPKEPMPSTLVQNRPSHNGWKNFDNFIDIPSGGKMYVTM